MRARHARRLRGDHRHRLGVVGGFSVLVLAAGPATALPARPAVPSVVVHVGCDGRLGSIPAAQNAAPRPSIGFATALETSFSGGGPQPTGGRPPQAAASTPSQQLVTNATNALQTMQSSAYVHTSLRYPVVDATYRTDCSGFASFLVNQVSPGTATDPFPALADLVRLGGKASADAGSGSGQPRAYANQFEEVFGALGPGVTDRFWRPVGTPRDLQPGDFVSWLLPPGSSDRDTGHVMVAATAATLGPPRTFTATTCATTGTPGTPSPTTGAAPNYGYDCHGSRIGYYEYDVTVIDSSGPHGPLAAPVLNKTPVSQIVAGEDSRNANPLNHPSANGGRVMHSGIGEGQIGLLTLTPDGPAVAFLWYPNDTTTPKFYDTASAAGGTAASAACPAGQLRPRAADTIPLLTRTHRSCVPGITFGRLAATS